VSLQRPGGLYLLSADTSLRQHVAAASSWLGRVFGAVDSVDEMLNVIASASPCAVLIDRDDPRSLAALHEVAPRIASTGAMAIAVVRGTYDDVPRGADIVADASTIPDVLRAVGRPPPEPNRAVDRLLGISVLGGPLDAALRRAEQEIAAALGAARCVIAIGTSSDETHDRCRAALACEATVIAPTSEGCASYIGVTFDDRVDGLGCLGLVANRARVFADVDRAYLESMATRLGMELAWRGTHARAADELDRLKHNAGLDALTGAWNRQAIARLTAMYLSTSMRFKQSLGVIAIDVVGLRGLNTRRGLDVGDAVLKTIADAARTQTRIEDIVGRLAPGMLVAILQGISLDGTHRVAARIKQELDTRLPAIAPGLAGEVQARFGVCLAYPNEDAGALLDRAARLARETVPGVPPKVSDVGDEVGTTLGGTYRLLHEIGQGAMGLVYRAEDLALERAVAIKMLRPDLVEDHEIVEQLRREASLLARLQHPNLVQVYSFAHGGGDAYIVMELVEGECLLQAIERHRLEGTSFTVGEVLAIASEVASALDALHEAGVVHRDVKPANVIRDPFRARSVLVDVGIARRYGQSVETAGTPGYVAPEVILGEDATPLSDVYGFASTVYSLLTLSSPWSDEEKVAILTRQASGDAPLPLSKFRPELAAADELFRTALHHEPGQRPGSAGMLARALATALAGHATPVVERSERPGPTGRVILPRRTQIAQARTRGVVFRSVARAIGVREAERMRDRLGAEDPELARALTDAAPDDWLATTLLTRLLSLAPTLADRDGSTLGRDVARATVRASFRRFFPASAATLMPDRTLSAIRTIWSRYHTWGTVSCMPLHAGESVVRITDTPREPDLCAFTNGMLEQMIVLSGGHAPHVEHERCEARGDTVCLYRVTWERAV
jgi:uncharacterized protein (TIGR02265 family)